MAQQLRKQGKRILFLGLFDTISPFVKYPSEKNSFGAKVKNMLKSSTNLSSFLQRLYGAIIKRIRYVYFQTICNVYRIFRRPIPQYFRYWYITEHNVKIMNKYQPKPYSGHLTLFRSTFATDNSPDRGWGNIALNGLEIIPIPARHRELVESAELGRELSSCLGHVQKENENLSTSNDILA
jgi:thioesterase domain-containing protein